MSGLREIQYSRELTAQLAFLNNFKNVVNHRVDIREDIKCYQDTLSYASSKVNYSVGENIHVLLSNMNLNIRSGTIGYNNKILVSDGKFSLGKNDEINAKGVGSANTFEAPTMKSYKVLAQTATTHKDLEQMTATHRDLEQKPIITHNEEKIALVLLLAGGFATWNIF